MKSKEGFQIENKHKTLNIKSRNRTAYKEDIKKDIKMLYVRNWHPILLRSCKLSRVTRVVVDCF